MLSPSSHYMTSTCKPSSTYMTTQTTTMSCRPLTTSNVTTNMVSIEQYNAIVSRLDAEVHNRSRLENELSSKHSEISFLKSRIASLEAAFQTHSNPSSNSTIPQPTTTTNTPSTSGNGNEKEILSHCSDISAHKAAVVAAAQQQPRPNDVSKKSPSTISGGVSKKSKSKKERATKPKIPGQSRYWTPEEHKLFLEALTKFGHKDLRNISAFVGTRNMTQVRTHSQKYFMRLMREAKRQNPAAPTKTNNSSEAETTPEPIEKEAIVSSTKQEPTVVAKENEKENGDKYSVPNTCGMTLLCLVGQDTLPM